MNACTVCTVIKVDACSIVVKLSNIILNVSSFISRIDKSTKKTKWTKRLPVQKVLHGSNYILVSSYL